MKVGNGGPLGAKTCNLLAVLQALTCSFPVLYFLFNFPEGFPTSAVGSQIHTVSVGSEQSEWLCATFLHPSFGLCSSGFAKMAILHSALLAGVSELGPVLIGLSP